MAALLAPADYWWSWGDLLIRWLHVIAGIAWIGSSFYFIALDHHLAPPADERDAARGVGGEVWEIHGGGFYRVEKFKVAPETLPDPLYWFKWEAYTTWLSGFALLCVVYFAHASTFLVDKSVADLDEHRGDPARDRRARGRLARLRHRLPAARQERHGARDRRRRLRRARRVGRVPALRAARCLHRGRRDARDDHGRERLLRDHPDALEARPRQGGRRGARPGLERPRASSGRSTTTTSPCRSCSRCSRTTSRSPTATPTPG